MARKNFWCRFWITTWVTFCGCSVFSCAHRTAQVAAPSVTDSSFLDLKPGGRLKVVVPLFSPEQKENTSSSIEDKGGTIVLSAAKIVGYQASIYSVQGGSKGNVRLHFLTAETARGDVKTALQSAPELPFSLPRNRQHIRLLYLVRQSQSDHNMAIIASRNLAWLNSFTQNLKRDSSLCRSAREVFCSWVPAGVAVRPE